MNARERFCAWIALNGWNDMRAGAAIGCDRGYVRRIASGERRPGLRVAASIERLTRELVGGPIRCVDWFVEEQAKRPQRSAA